jgi:DNA polymerase-4
MAVRKIVPIDMDAFYASVEQRDDPWPGEAAILWSVRPRMKPELSGYARPCQRSGRSAYVRKGIFVPPDFTRRRAVSHEVRQIFKRNTDLIEPLSLDEAYLDVTENKTRLSTATLVARTIRDRDTGRFRHPYVSPAHQSLRRRYIQQLRIRVA